MQITGGDIKLMSMFRDARHSLSPARRIPATVTFRPRAVLVTGGARRIGRAICEALSARGWQVVVHARTPGDEDAVALADRLGGKPVFADLSRQGAADGLFADTLAAAPDIRAVVCNAAVFSTAMELPPDEAAKLATVNVEAPLRLVELLAGHLADRGERGSAAYLLDCRILRQPAEEDTPYAASKRALWRAVRADAVRFAPTLSVNGVAPGPVLPPADAENREKGGPMLLPRRPSPGDVAAAVGFLLEAGAVTGQVLAVDSGQSILT